MTVRGTDDRVGYGQAQPGALLSFSGAVEAVEDLLALGDRNAGPGVLDDELHVRCVATHGYGH